MVRGGRNMGYIYGERVVLREYRQSDFAHMRAWVNDTDTTRYLSGIFARPQTEQNTQGFLNIVLAGEDDARRFVVADKKDESYLGQLDLYGIDWHSRHAEVGFVLASEPTRGKGIGTEALKLLLGYAFDTLGLNRVQLEVNAGNKRAIRCYEKAGFVFEGTRRQHIYRDGAFCDMHIMSVLEHEWRERQVDACSSEA